MISVQRFLWGVSSSIVVSSACLAVDAPVFLPAEGISPVDLPVVVTTATSGGTIHYTVNGSEPTEYDPVVVSGQSVMVKRPLTLKAKAWVGESASPTTSRIFEITGDVAGGGAHALALKSNRQIWGWASQANGRLGNGITSGSTTMPMAALKSPGVPVTDAVQVRAGFDHTLYLDAAGNVWGFGSNATSALGTPTTTATEYAYAVQVPSVPSSVEVGAGQDFSAAVTTSGNVYTWGSQTAGRLGNGAGSGLLATAGRVKTGAGANDFLTGIVGLDLGTYTGLAREANAMVVPGSNGYVWAWGGGGSGQLGQGDQATLAYAAKVRLSASTYLTDAWDVSISEGHSAIVRWKAGDPNLQGTVWCMGMRSNYNIGDNGSSLTGFTTYPTLVRKSDNSLLTGIIQIAAGPNHTLALDQNGNVWSWGYNGYGALGDNTNASRNYAVMVKATASTDLANITQVSTGSGYGNHGCSFAVSKDGTVYAWGGNPLQHLGIPSDSVAHKLPLVIGNIKTLPGFPDVTLSPSITVANSPGAATMTAVPTDPEGQVSKVEFYSQGILVGTRTSAPWTHTFSGLSAGSYHAYAVVTDAEGATGTSAPTDFTILPTLDSDEDGLLDEWEMTWFGNLTSQNGIGDPDNDGLTNAQEQAIGTSPLSAADTDGDGLPDDWEMFYFSNIGATNGAADHDGDHVTNAQEWQQRSSPVSAADADWDGMPDDWEQHRFGSTTNQNGSADPDGDGLTNTEEFTHSTDPFDKDTDDDYVSDGIEVHGA